MADLKEKMEELISKINEANRAYYQEAREIMSNFEYDALYDELVKLENESGIVLAGSPTKKVGYEIVSELPKEAHPQPRLSLAKTKSVDELAAFVGDKEGVLSWKLDGLTIVLTYENGELVKALTRGNGEIGEVVTANAKTFVNVPLTIPFKGHFAVRGEAVIHYSDFERMNAEIEDEEAKYKNPRNLCSGSVRQLNSEITAKRSVRFYVYELLEAIEPGSGEGQMSLFDTDNSEGKSVDFKNSRVNQLEFARKQGFGVVEYKVVTKDTMAETVAYFSEKIKTYDIPSDGLVLLYNDIAYGVSLGRTAKFPRHSIAFKWQDDTAKTVLREIEWSASRTGLINPVAIFDPVELEGTTVSRASVHNVSVMESLGLGIGDEISVYKANMIIPQIAENFTKSGNCRPPQVCPVCGGKTQIIEENDVKVLKCINPDCLAKKMKSLALFVSRDAMNIEGMSEATIEKLMEIGALHELSDFFKLKDYEFVIAGLEGFGEKSARNMIEAAEKARHTNAVRILYSLGIPGIGLAGAKLICKAFEGDFDKIKNATEEELTKIDKIGPVLAGDFVKFFAKPANVKTLDDILSEVVIEKEENSGDDSLSGKTFVITGSVTHFANRNEVKDLIESKGGKVTGSVTKNTDYLINNDITSGSSKNKTAKELGIPIITEEDFLKMIEG